MRLHILPSRRCGFVTRPISQQGQRRFSRPSVVLHEARASDHEDVILLVARRRANLAISYRVVVRLSCRQEIVYPYGLYILRRSTYLADMFCRTCNSWMTYSGLDVWTQGFVRDSTYPLWPLGFGTKQATSYYCRY